MPAFEDLFISLLDVMGINEEQVEAARQTLAEDSDFAYLHFYKLIDYTKDGFLTSAKVVQFAQENGIDLTPAEAYGLVQAMDWNNDGKVSVTDFSLSVLPWEYPSLRELAAGRDISTPLPSVSVTQLFIRWLNYEIIYFRNVESAKLKLWIQGKERIIDLFRRIAPLGTNSISLENLRKYCLLTGYNPAPHRFKGVFRRMDRAGFGLIRYPEFMKSVQPSSISAKSQSNLPSPKTSITESVSRVSIDQEFLQVCLHMIRLDSRLETIKRELACRADFTIGDAYRLFDSEDRGTLRLVDIREGCRALGIAVGQQELYRVVRRWNATEGNRVSLRDFEEFVLPRNRVFADNLRRKVPLNLTQADKGLVFTKKTVALFKHLLESALAHESEIVRLKVKFTSVEVLQHLFNLLDCDKDGVISMHDLQLGFARLGEVLDPVKSDLLLQRFDKNRRNRIDFPEFVEELCGTKPKW